MTPAKRAFDVAFALLLIVLLSPFIVLIALLIAICDGRPVFYFSERMKTPDTPFCLWKFRTMRVVANDSGVSTGYKQHRVTPLGRRLRANHETGETTYVTRCIPRKARLDLIWARHQSLCYDIRLICQTVIRVFSRRRTVRANRS